LSASDYTVLEANANTASLIVSAEGMESFSYSKSQAFLGMPFSENMLISETSGMHEALCLTVNCLAGWTYDFFFLNV